MTLPTYSSGLLFTRAHAAVRSATYAILETHGLTPSYWAILGAAVRSEEGVRLASVAKQMDVKAPLVTMLAGDLIDKGLINRVPHHTDKRAKLLVATAKGKKLADVIEAELSQIIAEFLQGASREQVNAFQGVLEIILANATRSSS